MRGEGTHRELSQLRSTPKDLKEPQLRERILHSSQLHFLNRLPVTAIHELFSAFRRHFFHLFVTNGDLYLVLRPLFFFVSLPWLDLPAPLVLPLDNLVLEAGIQVLALDDY